MMYNSDILTGPISKQVISSLLLVHTKPLPMTVQLFPSSCLYTTLSTVPVLAPHPAPLSQSLAKSLCAIPSCPPTTLSNQTRQDSTNIQPPSCLFRPHHTHPMQGMLKLRKVKVAHRGCGRGSWDMGNATLELSNCGRNQPVNRARRQLEVVDDRVVIQ